MADLLQAAIPAEQTGADKPPVKETPAGTQGDRPAWLPEKFKSPEDMAKAYSELEKKQAQTPPKDEEKKPLTPDPITPPESKEIGDAKAAVEKAGLKFDALAHEVAVNGSLSEESYKALEKAGYSKQFVDQFIEGQRAVSERAMNELYSSIGDGDAKTGETRYDAMIDWAAANLNKDEIAAYDAAVSSPNSAVVKLAVEGLYAKFSKAEGVEPRLVSGANTSDSTNVFRSWQEVQAAMQDPRYKSGDPAYHKDLDAKLARSKL